MLIAWIAILGALGTLARYGLSSYFPVFPWTTLLINVLGSLLIGVVAAPSLGDPKPSVALTAICVGLLGGLTTFSTFSFEVVRLWVHGQLALAFVYGTLSPAVCVGAAALGVWLRGWPSPG